MEEKVFGHAPTTAQAEHFETQLNFFEAIYKASGAYGDDANVYLTARGAVFGQMVGIQDQMVQFTGVPELFHPG